MGDEAGTRPTFEIGLVMAGAVSAGAYTAGVIDFILEALDAIEDVRNGVDTSYLNTGLAGETPLFDPPHRVLIRAMSGTSAGAMVTGMTAAMLGTRVPPVASVDAPRTPQQRTGNPLYDSWVQRIHADVLLGTGDLGPDRPIVSLLNSDELGHIARDALAVSQRNDARRSYIADRLPIYLCVGNLRGVRYSLALHSGDVAREHQMSMHADNVGFVFGPEGTRKDGMVPLTPAGTPENWSALGDAALASGAFPIGLAARALERDFGAYCDRPWFIPSAEQPPVRRLANGQPAEPPDSPESWRSRSGEFVRIPPLDHREDFPDGRYAFANVDGGVFNNEPLELCRLALAEEDGRNPRGRTEASRAVLMIDPFPNLFELVRDYDPGEEIALVNVAKRLLGAFVSQARFKADELALARDDTVFSRFAIFPVRYASLDAAEPATYALACGALGGFGGFLSREFRQHDYMLGRRNCQRFLRKHFVLPADPDNGVVNPIVAGWPNDANRAACAVVKEMAVDGEYRPVVHLPVIPLLGKLASEAYTRMPPWPARPGDLSVGRLREAVLGRGDALKRCMVSKSAPSWMFRQGINYFWWRKRKQWVDRFVIEPIVADLRKRGITPAA
ncbi:MAG: hypothetical protein IPM60_01000 [Rhodospirillales bacterium]|nr:hypothetical protein [Rhodospirillales bacterium]